MTAEQATRKCVEQEAAALASARASLVARLMGVGPEWAQACLHESGWWVDRWARYLVGDLVHGLLRSEVCSWLDDVVDTIDGRPDLSAPDGAWAEASSRDRVVRWWLQRARSVAEKGRRLEELLGTLLETRQ